MPAGGRDVRGLVLAHIGDNVSLMSSDRFYMQGEYHRPRTTMLVWLVSTISAAFVLQLVLLSPKLGPAALLVEKMVLTTESVRDWHLWTLATHSLLHSTDSVWP